MRVNLPTIRSLAGRLRDPRYYQVFALGSLLSFGVFELGIGARWPNVLGIFGTALGTQWGLTRWFGLDRFDPLSAVITSLSLSLLFRTDNVFLAIAAAALAIGSKFFVRFRGKHVFNPATFGMVSMILASDHTWISTGQWGSATLGALAVAALGMLVLTRARRAETTFAFLAAYAAIVAMRAVWLGDPPAIPLHQLKNGALLVFAFFMISDPRTAPDSAFGRVVFGTTVASVTALLQFGLFQPGAAVIALACCAPLAPAIDFVRRGRRYEWSAADALPLFAIRKETSHACVHNDTHHPVDHRSRTVGKRLLRILCRKGRHEPVQPRVAGRAGP